MASCTPGFPVHHQLLEFTQTHVRRVGDAIQLSHPLFSSCLQSFPETGSCNVGDQSLIPWREDLLEKKITAHSNILSWKIPWMEEPSGLTVAKSWTWLSDFTFSFLALLNTIQLLLSTLFWYNPLSFVVIGNTGSHYSSLNNNIEQQWIFYSLLSRIDTTQFIEYFLFVYWVESLGSKLNSIFLNYYSLYISFACLQILWFAWDYDFSVIKLKLTSKILDSGSGRLCQASPTQKQHLFPLFNNLLIHLLHVRY